MVVEGAGAENVIVSGAVCLFNHGDRTRRAHNIQQQVVSAPPGSRDVEQVRTRGTPTEQQKEEETASEAREEVLTGLADGWSNLGFAGSSEDGFVHGAKRGYTPNSECFCQSGLEDYPCTEFCEETLPCTVNMECMRDDQLVFPRQVPEQAAALIVCRRGGWGLGGLGSLPGCGANSLLFLFFFCVDFHVRRCRWKHCAFHLFWGSDWPNSWSSSW